MKVNNEDNIRYDYKTKKLLKNENATVIQHDPVIERENKKKFVLVSFNSNDFYVFKDIKEYVGYLAMYFDDVEDTDYKSIILYQKKDGYIVVRRVALERLIQQKQDKDFYKQYTEEVINELHSKGRLTPEEMVEIWNESPFCLPEEDLSKSVLSTRCLFFAGKCENCLKNLATIKDSYSKEDSDLARKLILKNTNES